MVQYWYLHFRILEFPLNSCFFFGSSGSQHHLDHRTALRWSTRALRCLRGQIPSSCSRVVTQGPSVCRTFQIPMDYWKILGGGDVALHDPFRSRIGLGNLNSHGLRTELPTNQPLNTCTPNFEVNAIFIYFSYQSLPDLFVKNVDFFPFGNCEVLYRAWCVAEIVEANVLNIPARREELNCDWKNLLKDSGQGQFATLQ